MHVTITSHGPTIPAVEPDLVCDLTEALHNPPGDPRLLDLNGDEQPIRDHVLATPGAQDVIRHLVRRTEAALRRTADRPVHVHVHSPAGRHRPVAIASAAARVLALAGTEVHLEHLDAATLSPSKTAPRQRYFKAPASYSPQPDDLPAVILLGNLSAPTWQAEAAAVLLSAGAVVLSPDSPTTEDDTAWAEWIHHNLHRHAALALYWFPNSLTSPPPAPSTLNQLRATLSSSRPLVVGAEPGYAEARALVHQARLIRPGLTVHANFDAVLDEALRRLPAPTGGDR